MSQQQRLSSKIERWMFEESGLFQHPFELAQAAAKHFGISGNISKCERIPDWLYELAVATMSPSVLIR